MTEDIYISRSHIYPDIHIITDDVDLLNKIKAFWQPFITECSSKAIEISLLKQKNGYCVKTLMDNFISENPLQEIINFLYSQIHFEEGFFGLHAASVELNGKAYILAGSTMTGKSTLTAYLANKGFDYVTDDCVLIEKENKVIYPFCNYLHLREGGIEVLKNIGIDLKPLVFIQNGTINRFLYLPEHCTGMNIPIGGIFFIKRSNENTLSAISSSESIINLLESAIIHTPLTLEYMRFLTELSRIGCYSVTYHDMEYFLEVFER